jgi:hypothetical protein
MMPDSNATPPSDKEPRPEHEADDEAVDLNDFPSDDDGVSAALSFSGVGLKRNGSGPPSSGVKSWEQIREEASKPASDHHLKIEPPAAADDVDPDSDLDLLREVLADEPSPSSIILKDPSHGEVRALSSDSDSNVIRRFELPPELEATKPGDSSILSEPAAGMASDVFGSSSRVDLLRAGDQAGLSGESLQSTDEVERPPAANPPTGGSSSTLLAEPVEGGSSSSAINLGSDGVIDLPYPLGLDSSVGSRVGAVRPAAPAERDDPDSGTVDLLSAGDEFDVGVSAVTESPSWAAAREDMPPTVPMVPAGKARLVAWAGGGTAGLIAGVALCAGLWFTGVVPNQSAPKAPAGPDPAAIHAQVTAAAQQARNEEAKKTAAAAADARKARDELTSVNSQLAQAKVAADATKRARDQVAALTKQVKQAEVDRDRLKASVDSLTADKTTAATKLREADVSLTDLRDRLAKAEGDARTSADRLTQVETARQQSVAFATEVSRRLRTSPTAPAAAVLAALDRALAPPEPVAAAPGVPSVPPSAMIRTPEKAQQVHGIAEAAYRSGNYQLAEREFARLAVSPEANAIHWYYLGLTEWRLGKDAEAAASFNRGRKLERDSRPPPGEVEAAFERLGRADHEVVNAFRR